MSVAPALSVIVSAYRPRPDWLRAAVASALDQTCADLEVLVLEDPAEAPSAEPDLPTDPRVQYRRNPRRLGLVASRNAGLSWARAELVAILDADDLCAPERFERQLAFLAEHPDVAVVGSQLEFITESGDTLGYRAYPTCHDAIVAAMRRYNPLAHPSVMFRRSAVLAVGGYAEVGEGACDDYDLWARVARAGHRFANLPEALVRYRLHDGAMKARRLRATLRDTLRVKRHHFGAELTLRDRLRMRGEAVLALLPPRLVTALFRRLTVRRELRVRSEVGSA